MEMEVKSWGSLDINDGTNYTATLVERPLLPSVQAQLVARNDARPVISSITYEAVRFSVRIMLEGDDLQALRTQLAQAFDPRSRQVKALVIQDGDGGRARYLMCLCESLVPVPGSARRTFIANFVLDGFGDPDGRWRKEVISSATWNITSSGQTTTVTNAGDDSAYPIFTIEPTSPKTGDYAYKRFVSIKWGTDIRITRHPVDLTGGGWDTSGLVSGGKMQADGDDLRVVVDGNETDRWLYDINTATTKVWANLDFERGASAKLDNAIGSGDTVETIDAHGFIASSERGEAWFDLFPSTGILLINSEVFTYTGKNTTLRRFTGVRRAQKGSTAAAHSADDTVYWIQHDLWLMYGNSSVSAPTVADTYKPIFNLSSTNTSWDYDNFYDMDNPNRPGSWYNNNEGAEYFYGADHAGLASPFEELGIARGSASGSVNPYWYTYNALGITNANFQTGEVYKTSTFSFTGPGIQSSEDGETWIQEVILSPTIPDSTWTSWSQNEALESGSTYVKLYFTSLVFSGGAAYMECSDVTLSLNSSNTPIATVGGEQGNYSLNCIITNNTNGYALQVTYSMTVNQQFELDTDGKTLTDLTDDSGQFQALSVIGPVRRDWLPLAVGDNELEFDDTGTNGVTVTVEWYERHFD